MSIFIRFFVVPYSFCLIGFLFADKRLFIDGLSSKKEFGFFCYGYFCQFIYSLLQFIVPNSELPAIEHWDSYLNFTFTEANTMKVDDFLLESPLRDVLQRCQIGTPGSFLQLVILFIRSVLQLLLGHSVAKSKVLRGLSSFDPSVMCHSTESIYTECITSLVNCFMAFGWIPEDARDVTIGEYRAYLLLLRENGTVFGDDFISQLLADWCFLARKHLVRVFKLAFLCSESVQNPLPDVVFDLPGMGMSRIHMVSALNTLCTGLTSIPTLSTTVCDDKSVLHIRGLLDERDTLFCQRGYNALDSLEKRDRSSLYSRLAKSHSRFDPSTVRKSVPSKDASGSPSKLRKTTVAFDDTAGTSRPREKLPSLSGAPKKSRSKSPSTDIQVPPTLSAPKGNFRKSPKK